VTIGMPCSSWLVLVSTRDILDAVCRVEVVLVFVMIGIPYLGEERISPCLLVIVPRRRRAVRTPVPGLEDGIWLPSEDVLSRAFPPEWPVHVATPLLRQTLAASEFCRAFQISDGQLLLGLIISVVQPVPCGLRIQRYIHRRLRLRGQACGRACS
jgi:hypothetical protein